MHHLEGFEELKSRLLSSLDVEGEHARVLSAVLRLGQDPGRVSLRQGQGMHH